jgi:tetratricopeptide (TPR) repeat protein
MRRSLLLAHVCLAFAGFAPLIDASEDEARKDDPSADRQALISQSPDGADKEALKVLRQQIAHQPSVMNSSAGDEVMPLFDNQDTIDAFSSDLEQNPFDVLVRANRGLMYAATGELDRGLADATLAIELDPKCAPAYLARAFVLRHRDQLDKAIADLSEAIRLDAENSSDCPDTGQTYFPDRSDFFAMRGEIYSQQGNMEKAMADYNRAIELDPEKPRHFCERGDLRTFLGDYTGAASDYIRAQKLDSNYSPPYLSYAWLLATCDDPQILDPARAVEYAKIALDLDPEREDAWAAYAAALAAAHRFDEAVKWQQRYVNWKGLSQAHRMQEASRLALYASHVALVLHPQFKKPAAAAQPAGHG